MNPNNKSNCNPHAVPCPVPDPFSIPIQNIQGPPGPQGPPGLHQFTVGVNAAPLPELTGLAFVTLSTLTITIDDPGDTVRFIATIRSSTSGSSISTAPFFATVIEYQIRRVSPAASIQLATNTDFDLVTTTFTAFDRPGVGTFTYILEGHLLRRTTPPGTLTEFIQDVVFTAEEIEP